MCWMCSCCLFYDVLTVLSVLLVVFFLYSLADLSDDTSVTDLMLCIIHPLCLIFWFLCCFFCCTRIFFLFYCCWVICWYFCCCFNLCLIPLLCTFLWCFYCFVGVLAVVVGGFLSVMGAMQRVKGSELNCELDYTISFWSWILSWKSLHFVEISMFRRYYPHFVEISTSRGYYPHFVDIIRILRILSAMATSWAA